MKVKHAIVCTSSGKYSVVMQVFPKTKKLRESKSVQDNDEAVMGLTQNVFKKLV